MADNKLVRMDNIGIVVESLDDTILFFTELGIVGLAEKIGEKL